MRCPTVRQVTHRIPSSAAWLMILRTSSVVYILSRDQEPCMRQGNVHHTFVTRSSHVHHTFKPRKGREWGGRGEAVRTPSEDRTKGTDDPQHKSTTQTTLTVALGVCKPNTGTTGTDVNEPRHQAQPTSANSNKPAPLGRVVYPVEGRTQPSRCSASAAR